MKKLEDYMKSLSPERRAKVEAMGAKLIEEEKRRRAQMAKLVNYVSSEQFDRLQNATQEHLDHIMEAIEDYENLGSKEEDTPYESDE